MKTTRTYKLNKPDYSDPIDVEELNENFDVIDFALEATQIKKTRVSNTISEKCILPYYRIRNNNDFDVTVTDRNFSVDYVIEAGKSKRFDVDGTNTDMNFYVQGLHEVEFEWFVFVKDAIEEGGGGGTGGTKNYNELINQPKINGVILTGDVALATLGIKGAAAKDVDTTGTAVTSTSTNVPTSAAVNAFVGSEIAKLGKPMEFKGKFSKAADVPDLSDTKEGWTYKVAVAGTYAGQKAKVGDAFISTGTAWEYFPSGDDEFSGENLLMTEYTKGSAKPESTGVSDTDTLNEAVQKIEWSLADKVDKDTTVNGKKLNDNIVLSGNDEKLNATSYSKDTEAKDITKDSKIDEAVAQLEYRVDTKVTKTSVSSGENSTTSVINVTDAKAQMAMVASIKGVTRRFVQMAYNGDFAKTDGWKVYDSTKASISISSGIATVTYKTAGSAGFVYGISNATYPQCLAGHKYFLSAEVCPSVTRKVAFDNVGAEQFTCEAGKYTRIEARYACGADTLVGCFIKPIEGTIAVGETLKIRNAFIIDATAFYGSGKEPSTVASFNADFPNIYYPYTDGGQLWSAPVESVVSHSANKFDYNNTTRENVDASGNITSNPSMVLSDYMPVNGNFSASWSKGSNGAYMRFVMYDSNKKFVKREDVSAVSNTFATKSNTGYVRICFEANGVDKESIALYNGTENRGFIQYNKTTVLVPSAVKNLPDYGLGIVKSDGTIVSNEVDFENGVYHHRVGKWKPAPTVWAAGGSSTAPTHVYTTVPTDAKKVNDYLWLCNMYSQVTNTWWNNNASTRDKVFASGSDGAGVQLVDRSCTTLDQYKTKLANIEFVYELASDDVKPLSDYIRPLPVESGGTLTLVNEHNLDMPSVIKYKKEVN